MLHTVCGIYNTPDKKTLRTALGWRSSSDGRSEFSSRSNDCFRDSAALASFLRWRDENDVDILLVGDIKPS